MALPHVILKKVVDTHGHRHTRCILHSVGRPVCNSKEESYLCSGCQQKPSSQHCCWPKLQFYTISNGLHSNSTLLKNSCHMSWLPLKRQQIIKISTPLPIQDWYLKNATPRLPPSTSRRPNTATSRQICFKTFMKPSKNNSMKMSTIFVIYYKVQHTPVVFF